MSLPVPDDVDKMKVAALLPPPNWGGLHTHIALTANAFQAHGYGEIIPLIPVQSDHKNITQKFSEFNIEPLMVDMSRLRYSLNPKHIFKYVTSLKGEVTSIKALLKAEQFTHIQSPGAHHFHGAFCTKEAHIPFVWQLHSDLAPKWLRWLSVKFHKNYVDCVMTNGHNIAEKFSSINKIDQKKFQFYPVVDSSQFQTDQTIKDKMRNSFGIMQKDILIGTVGIRTRQKNHLLLIKAFEKLIQTHDNCKLVIIGNYLNEREDEYKREVIQNPVAQNLISKHKLIFIEPDQKISDYLNMLDIFALSSKAEGMPIALAEAMSLSLPTISTDVGAISEMIEDGQTGLLSLPNDSDDFAGKLKILVEDPQKRIIFGANAKQKALSQFSPSLSAKTHYDAYKEALRHFTQSQNAA